MAPADIFGRSSCARGTAISLLRAHEIEDWRFRIVGTAICPKRGNFVLSKRLKHTAPGSCQGRVVSGRGFIREMSA